VFEKRTSIEESMERYGGGAIEVRDYDPRWPIFFEQECSRLRFVVGTAIKIEHMGSTSVPGLAAKPIIDILVGIPDLSQARARLVRPIERLGYNYIPEYAAWLPGELFFRKGMPGPWTHHLHVMEPSNARWRDFLIFRDYLRLHPEIAAAYGSLKKALAAEFGENIEGFRKAKHRFVREITKKALATFGQ
jgi:GrpB-like predicted nucleotidyltransferase (UPF0157 family)